MTAIVAIAGLVIKELYRRKDFYVWLKRTCKIAIPTPLNSQRKTHTMLAKCASAAAPSPLSAYRGRSPTAG